MKFKRLLVFSLLFWLMFIQLGSAFLHKHNENSQHKHFSGTAYMAVEKNASHDFCFGCFIAKLNSGWLAVFSAIAILFFLFTDFIFSSRIYNLFRKEIIQLSGRAPPVV